jgi:membrane associated rhomboid family serine protease
LINRSSAAVKVICTVVIVLYIFSFIPSLTDLLSVNPGISYPPHFRLWSFITAPFLETHWWNVLVDVILTAMAAQMLEPLWTSKELLIFVCIVGLASSVVTAFIIVLLYIPLRRDSLLFSSFHGFVGILAGYSVAFKQVMPDHSVIPTSMKGFQLKSQVSRETLQFLVWCHASLIFNFTVFILCVFLKSSCFLLDLVQLV